MTECKIEKTKKSRVMGNNGPRRHEMVEYAIIDDKVPQQVVDDILNIGLNYYGNDLGGDSYQISQHCDVKSNFTSSDSYRQILLQHLDGDDDIDETKYTKWREDLNLDAIREYLERTFKKVYRARISVMPKGGDLNWHIDTDTSVLCRAQIPAFHEGSKFQWKTKRGEFDLEMIVGNTYFVNAGWLHRVVNESDNVRVVLIFGIDYDNIPEKELLLIKNVFTHL